MKERKQGEKYIPTHKEFEAEYTRSLSSERLCEYSCTEDEYKKLYGYTKWLEKQLEKFVDMTMREGYRR
jgi:hypothetical protein